jgi:uncharacterized caspase-like protein
MMDVRMASSIIGRILALILLAVAAAGLPAAAAAETRVALVIGNSKYQHVVPLRNPGNDARAIADALGRLGFQVQAHVDLDKRGMEEAVRAFAESAVGVETALFYYAGHAIQYEGKNFLLPIDAPRAESEEEFRRTVDFSLLDFELVLRQLQSARASLLFLDACRNNPFEFRGKIRSGLTRGGLAPVAARIGTLIAYATEPYNVAWDGEGVNSPFSEAMLRHMHTEGLEVRSLMTKVRADVASATDGQQVPWDHSSLLSDIYFVPPSAEPEIAVDDELVALNEALSMADPVQQQAALQSFQTRYPRSAYRELVSLKLV